MHERRDYLRIDKRAMVSYDVLAENNEIRDEGVGATVNLSRSGVHLELPRETQRGDQLELTLNINGELMFLAGTVVWVEHRQDVYDVGLKLNDYPVDYVDRVRAGFAS